MFERMYDDWPHRRVVGCEFTWAFDSPHTVDFLGVTKDGLIIRGHDNFVDGLCCESLIDRAVEE